MFLEAFLLWYTVYFTEKKQGKSYRDLSKTCDCKLFFVWSYCKWARRHARHDGRWVLKALCHGSTLARNHARHAGNWAHKRARHIGMLALKARNLADSEFYKGVLYLLQKYFSRIVKKCLPWFKSWCMHK